MIYIGIDNGLDGALVALDARGRLVSATVMPTVKVSAKSARRALRPVAIQTWLNEHCWGLDVARVALEAAQPFPRDGKASAFKTGYGFGLIEGMLLGVARYTIVRPKEWQRITLKGIPGDGKQRAILRAEQAVPELDLMPGKKRKPHDGLADACCLALYARWADRGE